MKKNKKLLSSFLAFSMVLALMPATQTEVYAVEPVDFLSKPVMNDTYNVLYANGNAIIIEAGSGDGTTTIYIDTNANGVVDGDEQSLHAAGITRAPVDNSDLSGYSIFGGAMDEVVSSTKITMTGGTVRNIYAGGWAGDVTGDTNLVMTGGKIVDNLLGGGDGSYSSVANTNVSISGGEVGRLVFAGGWGGDVLGDTNLEISGNTKILGSVHGGSNTGDVSGDTNITISDNVQVDDIYGAGANEGVNGNTNLKILGGTVNNVYGGSMYNSGVTVSSNLEIGNNAKIGNVSDNSGVVLNENGIGNGIDNLTIASDLSGDAKVHLVIPSSAVAGDTIATSVVQSDVQYLTISETSTYIMGIINENLVLRVADVTALTTAIDNANKAKEGIVESDGAVDTVTNGTKFVPIATMTAFNQAITNAETVFNNANATDEQIANMVIELNTAIDTFNDAIQIGTRLKDQMLSFSQTEITASMGDTNAAEPMLSGDQTKVTYTSSNESVATVNTDTGEVAMVGAGTAVITATAEKTDIYYAGSASYKLTVNNGTVETGTDETTIFDGDFNDLTGVTLNGVSLKIGANGELTEYTNYTANNGVVGKVFNGSIGVTLYKEFLAFLPEGENTLSVTTSTGTSSTVMQVPTKTSHTLIVNNEGDGTKGTTTHTVGEVLTINAGAREGYRFTGWTANGVTLDNPRDTNTQFVMMANDATITANYEFNPDVEYALAVDGGTASVGTTNVEYVAMGETVTITAIVPDGKKFIEWNVSVGGITLADSKSATTTFVMPASPVYVIAIFEDIAVAPVTTPTPTETETPSTGDSSNVTLLITLLGLSVVGISVVFANRKKWLKLNK